MAAESKVASIFDVARDRTVPLPPWNTCFKFKPDGLSYVCLHESCTSRRGASDDATGSTGQSKFGQRAPINHWFDIHLWDCPPEKRDEQIAEWKSKARKFDALKTPAAAPATDEVGAGRRVTAAALRAKIIELTCRHKQPECWVTGPVQDLVAFIQPQLHVYSRQTLGRDILAEIARVKIEVGNILKKKWGVSVSALAAGAGAGSAAAAAAADVTSVAPANPFHPLPSVLTDGWTPKYTTHKDEGDKVEFFLMAGATPAFEMSSYILGLGAFPGPHDAVNIFKSLREKLCEINVPEAAQKRIFFAVMSDTEAKMQLLKVRAHAGRGVQGENVAG